MHKGCDSCGLGCRSLSIMPSAADFDGSIDAVHRTGLLQVVAWLFGAPLLLLLGAVWGLENLQTTAQPLVCGLVLAGIGWLVFVLARSQGNKLLNMVKPHTRSSAAK